MRLGLSSLRNIAQRLPTASQQSVHHLVGIRDHPLRISFPVTSMTQKPATTPSVKVRGGLRSTGRIVVHPRPAHRRTPPFPLLGTSPRFGGTGAPSAASSTSLVGCGLASPSPHKHDAVLLSSASACMLLHGWGHDVSSRCHCPAAIRRLPCIAASAVRRSRSRSLPRPHEASIRHLDIKIWVPHRSAKRFQSVHVPAAQHWLSTISCRTSQVCGTSASRVVESLRNFFM